MHSILDLTAVKLRRAARLQEKIESLKWEIGSILDGPSHVERGGAAEGRRKGKRTMSAATKAMLAAVARARWRKAKVAGRNAL